MLDLIFTRPTFSNTYLFMSASSIHVGHVTSACTVEKHTSRDNSDDKADDVNIPARCGVATTGEPGLLPRAITIEAADAIDHPTRFKLLG